MLIAIIGESCVGKSTFAAELNERLSGQVYIGKDYLRLAKNEAIARKLFEKKLAEAVTGEHLIFVISEKEQVSFLPDGAVTVLMTADLSSILERFSARMRGNLPELVRQMLEKKHGCFDNGNYDHRIHNCRDIDTVIGKICGRV